MAGISPISGNSSVNYYGAISSGKRINKAADDASGMAIAKKMESQSTGLDVGSQNAKQGTNLLNVADGALGQINDSLQRIYEISVKASNSFMYTSKDLGAMQDEINGLMSGIQDIAKGTEYNTMKILDGNMADMELATNPDGTGQSIKMANGTLEALGIDGYDVTGKFDINRITSAIDKVNEARSQVGAQTNALEYAYNQNNYTAQNVTASQSAIEDLDIPEAITEQKKNQVLDSYQNMMLKKKMEDEAQSVLGLLPQ